MLSGHSFNCDSRLDEWSQQHWRLAWPDRLQTFAVPCTSSSRNLPYSLLVRVRQKSTETIEEKEKKKRAPNMPKESRNKKPKSSHSWYRKRCTAFQPFIKIPKRAIFCLEGNPSSNLITLQCVSNTDTHNKTRPNWNSNVETISRIPRHTQKLNGKLKKKTQNFFFVCVCFVWLSREKFEFFPALWAPASGNSVSGQIHSRLSSSSISIISLLLIPSPRFWPFSPVPRQNDGQDRAETPDPQKKKKLVLHATQTQPKRVEIPINKMPTL